MIKSFTELFFICIYYFYPKNQYILINTSLQMGTRYDWAA